jgi:4-hydroxybutyryl-CoA dehydratase/vinylacetyl-CoA-Delta-isomerase
MGLKTAAAYVESLRDGRVTCWDGERIDDITAHPRFKVPIGSIIFARGERPGKESV